VMLNRSAAEDLIKRERRILLPLTQEATIIEAIVVEFGYWVTTRLGRRHESIEEAWNAWTRATPARLGWADAGWEHGVPRFPRQVAAYAMVNAGGAG